MHVVPLKYSFGRQQHIDKVTQTTSEFYEQMQNDSNHPKTSQPAPKDFKKTWQARHISKYRRYFCFTRQETL